MTDLIWLKDTVVEVDELWLLPEFRYSPLPRWAPEYPVVSKEDSNILHFILPGPRSNAKTWVITLDMGKKLLKSYTPFISEQKVDFEGFDLDTRNIFCDTPFICCDFGCLNKTTECLMDPIDMKSGTTLTYDSETKKRKSPSSNLDFLELCDSSDDDDVFSDAYDSDSSLETPANRAMRSLSLSFFEVLRTMPVMEINDPTRQWHCPVCRNDPGATVWHKGLNALMDHARTEATQRVEFHKKLLTLLEYKKRAKLARQPMTKVCHETIDQKRLDLKVKMALDLLKLPLKGHATRGARDTKDNMARGTRWMESRASQMDFKVQTMAGF